MTCRRLDQLRMRHRPILWLLIAILSVLVVLTIAVLSGVPPSTVTAYSTAFVAVGTFATVATLLYQMGQESEKRRHDHLVRKLIPNTIKPIQEKLNLYSRVLDRKEDFRRCPIRS